MRRPLGVVVLVASSTISWLRNVAVSRRVSWYATYAIHATNRRSSTTAPAVVTSSRRANTTMISGAAAKMTM